MGGFILGIFNMRVTLWFMLALIVFNHEGGGNTQARCVERERQALLRFKESLPDYGNQLLSWKSNDHDCCAWKRIRCDNRTNHVIMLDFGPEFQYLDNGFSWSAIGKGEINFALVELQYLEYLDLSCNYFTRIPKFIGSFKRLNYLNLSGNPLIGTIPSQIQNLSRLQFLDLDLDLDLESFGQMSIDSLEWLSKLPSLRSLTFGHINFSNAFDWLQSIKSAKSLSTLNLLFCQFPEIDIWPLYHINSSNSLKALKSSGTFIPSRTFPWLLNVSRSLVYVNLSSNEIEGGIPKSWGNFCSLKALDLSNNNFTGTLPDFLKSLTGCSVDSLEILSLSRNQLGGVIPDMKRFPSLRKLYLDNNKLEGPFPYTLGRIPRLLNLKLDNNKLTGPLPDLSRMSSLRELSLANNKLNSTIPETIGQLSNLRVLDFSSNSFTGVISETHLQKLFNLKQLALSFNSLTLNFNSSWVPLFQLSAIKLSCCKLGPQFPKWVKTQQNISVIDLYNSSISDTIPNWFCNLTAKLKYLNLSFNNISGTLPNFPLNPNNYPVVDLSSNQIYGAIPRSLSNATVLHLSNNKFGSLRLFLCTSNAAWQLALDLSNNLLFESLPDCWKNFESLLVINLENNKLFGVIPRSMGQFLFLNNLRLSHNNFSGDLPSSLKNCTELQVLDVGENNLKGEIPTWIGERLTLLVVLRLTSNKFRGSIPLNLCHLQSIRILDLSFNNIFGTIPSCMDNFTSMVQKREDSGLSIFFKFGGLASEYEVLFHELITWKGVELHYGKNIGSLRLIDLSRNKLTGEIPKELTNLVEVVQLNFSRNNLKGTIPEKIGRLNKLESLDLSHNHLSGKIPTSLADITFLGYLDLSNNHLSGRIPTGTQLQSFNASQYVGNPELCGQPLNITCPGDKTLQDPSDSSGDESYADASGEWLDMSWFRMGIKVGFAIGFSGVCLNLWLNISWRLASFRFFHNLGDWLYVTITVKVAILKRTFSG